MEIDDFMHHLESMARKKEKMFLGKEGADFLCKIQVFTESWHRGNHVFSTTEFLDLFESAIA